MNIGLLKIFYRITKKTIFAVLIGVSVLGILGSAGKEKDTAGSFYIQIKCDKKTLYDNLSAVLKAHYFLISDSNQKELKLIAKREPDPFVLKELWYRIVGTIDHEIVLEFEVTEENKIINLFVKPSMQYKRHSKIVKVKIREKHPVFKEIKEILTETKNKSETK